MKNAIKIGCYGNKVSKIVTDSDEVSVGRTVVATGTGAAMGALVGGTAAVFSAPVTIPLAVAGGVIAAVFSLFD